MIGGGHYDDYWLFSDENCYSEFQWNFFWNPPVYDIHFSANSEYQNKNLISVIETFKNAHVI